MLAIDLAKRSFKVCGVSDDGRVVFNKSVSRSRLMQLLSSHRACIVAMEACATSHHWGRLALSHGHEVRLIPANYVKPFVKRQKNDYADAEAVAEAATRPNMRFVAVKSEPPRVCRRLQLLRDWSHDESTQEDIPEIFA
jgi:transposase